MFTLNKLMFFNRSFNFDVDATLKTCFRSFLLFDFGCFSSIQRVDNCQFIYRHKTVFSGANNKTNIKVSIDVLAALCLMNEFNIVMFLADLLLPEFILTLNDQRIFFLWAIVLSFSLLVHVGTSIFLIVCFFVCRIQ